MQENTLHSALSRSDNGVGWRRVAVSGEGVLRGAARMKNREGRNYRLMLRNLFLGSMFFRDWERRRGSLVKV